jgi:hypothetical protein
LLGAYAPLFATARARRLVAAALLGRLAVGLFDISLPGVAVERSGTPAAFVAAAAAMAIGAALLVARRETLSVASQQR